MARLESNSQLASVQKSSQRSHVELAFGSPKFTLEGFLELLARAARPWQRFRSLLSRNVSKSARRRSRPVRRSMHLVGEQFEARAMMAFDALDFAAPRAWISSPTLVGPVTGHFANSIDQAALNPQPIPPRDVIPVARGGFGTFDPVALNPQPIPPQEFDPSFRYTPGWFENVAINPQPLPPRFGTFDPVSLNPQPIPPSAIDEFGNFDPASLNPQPIPPQEFDPSFRFTPGWFDNVALNPQPLLPRFGDFDPVALNPQPIPPREWDPSFELRPGWFGNVSLNPQPIPPLEIIGTLGPVALNPQPIPPRDMDPQFQFPTATPPVFVPSIIRGGDLPGRITSVEWGRAYHEHFPDAGVIYDWTDKLITASFDAATGELTVKGTAEDDQIRILQYDGKVTVRVHYANSRVSAGSAFQPHDIQLSDGSVVTEIDADSIRKIKVDGLAGDDKVLYQFTTEEPPGPSLRMLEPNWSGHDAAFDPSERTYYVEMNGGDDQDTLTVIGYSQARLVGGDGHDELHGGSAVDRLFGGEGEDYIWGHGEVDYIYGENGDDHIWGGAGDDHIWGGDHHDELYGEAGYDKLKGESGDDHLEGGTEDDTLEGASGVDTLLGGEGNDTLTGGTEGDFLYGEGGDDTLNGGVVANDLDPGRDTLDGGADFDTFDKTSAGEALAGSEVVDIDVPNDGHQDDHWSCGPNSVSRVLRAYGMADATYERLRGETRQDNIISMLTMGTLPQDLHDVIRNWKPDAQLVRDTTLERLLDKVGEGKTVMALVRTMDDYGQLESESATVSVAVGAALGAAAAAVGGPVGVLVGGVVGAIFGSNEQFPKLHWLVIRGYNKATQELSIADTKGQQYQVSFAKFQRMWDLSMTGATGSVLEGLGASPRTFIA